MNMQIVGPVQRQSKTSYYVADAAGAKIGVWHHHTRDKAEIELAKLTEERRLESLPSVQQYRRLQRRLGPIGDILFTIEEPAFLSNVSAVVGSDEAARAVWAVASCGLSIAAAKAAKVLGWYLGRHQPIEAR